MKKEVLVFLVLILLSGCLNNSVKTVEIDQREEINPFGNKVTYVPTYYLQFYDVTPSHKVDIEHVIKNGDDCTNVFDDRMKSECGLVMQKLEAFKTKNNEICRTLWYIDPSHFETCFTPLAVYTAIHTDNKGYCGEYLTISSLIKMCEDNYEKYN